MNKVNREFLQHKETPIHDPAMLEWGFDDEPTHFTAYSQTATWLQLKAKLQSDMAAMFMLELPAARDMKEAAYELWKYALFCMIRYYFDESLAEAVGAYVDLWDIQESDKIIGLIEVLAKYPRITEAQIRAYLQDNI